MPDSISKTIETPEQIQAAAQWVADMARRALAKGPVLITLSRQEEERSNKQNKKLWPMLTDISQQLQWHGQWLSPDDWKDLLGHEWKAQRVVPGISGGFVALGNVRTSKMRKREFSELIEIGMAFGSEHGVKWSDPALKEHENYREAQQ